jgi:hypothetical protein
MGEEIAGRKGWRFVSIIRLWCVLHLSNSIMPVMIFPYSSSTSAFSRTQTKDLLCFVSYRDLYECFNVRLHRVPISKV